MGTAISVQSASQGGVEACISSEPRAHVNNNNNANNKNGGAGEDDGGCGGCAGDAAAAAGGGGGSDTRVKHNRARTVFITAITFKNLIVSATTRKVPPSRGASPRRPPGSCEHRPAGAGAAAPTTDSSDTKPRSERSVSLPVASREPRRLLPPARTTTTAATTAPTAAPAAVAAANNNTTTATTTATTTTTTTSSPQQLMETLLMRSSSGDLLNCLGTHLCRRCALLRHISPADPVRWLRAVDRTLLEQGWQETAFLTPANVLFVYMLCRESVSEQTSSEGDLQASLLVCLYLAFSYMGNEISYPLKPFVVEAFKERFWERCLNLIDSLSGQMLLINASPTFCIELLRELKGEGNAEETRGERRTINLDR
ncbi:cyclin-dependent kinase 5 activator 1-like [Lethenteron reissneri]|uniref:cyclin-dependent kinase 5 activator 1-like n=1 Tax=Lethenteron reissneri TaxID=7753 RepID=UPI002AB652FC|nr:cyclin-dependent kinase 5 activator 1-like [Lethenteron reissneri]